MSENDRNLEVISTFKENMSVEDLRDLALQLRRDIIELTWHSGTQSSHVGGELSAAEIMAVLYGGILKIDPQNPTWIDRDRIILSKGHASGITYTAMAWRGFFRREVLWNEFNKVNGRFRRDREFEIGKALVLKEGGDITLIGCGFMVKRCLDAADQLAKQGISAEVINCSTIKPLDENTIFRSATKTKAVVTAENHSVIGGLGSAITEFVSEYCPVPVKRIGILDSYGESGNLDELFLKYGLITQAVMEAVKCVLLIKKI